MADLDLLFPVNLERIKDGALENELERMVGELQPLCERMKVVGPLNQKLTVKPAFNRHADVSNLGIIQHFEKRYGDDFLKNLAYLVFSTELKSYRSVAEEVDRAKDWRQLAEAFNRNHYYGLAAEALYSTLRVWVISSQLACPGLVETHESIAIVDGGILDQYDAVFHDISMFVEFDEIKQHILFERLDFATEFSWYIKQISNKIGVTTSQVGRACCSLTYLFRDNVDYEDPSLLFWAIAGLEAVLSDGRPAYVREMVSRLDALGVLKNPEASVKPFEEMYKIRHGVIHGSFDFYPKYTQILSQEGFRRNNKMMHATALASCLLVAVLQKMCMRDVTELKFRTALA
jgi:hypothetical protein